MNVRLTTHGDIAGLQQVLDETGLFPSEMLPDMLEHFLSSNTPDDLWLTIEVNGRVTGFCYAVPEKFTDGTWNMLAIAVLGRDQCKGYGAALCNQLEDLLRDRGQRILIVDTSGSDAFEKTREFYRRLDYIEEARIRDFWAAGDDKVTFRKSLV